MNFVEPLFRLSEGNAVKVGAIWFTMKCAAFQGLMQTDQTTKAGAYNKVLSNACHEITCSALMSLLAVSDGCSFECWLLDVCGPWKTL